jgi:hypothetical protein
LDFLFLAVGKKENVERGFRIGVCVDGGCSILFVASLRRRMQQDIFNQMQVGGSKFELQLAGPAWLRLRLRP